MLGAKGVAVRALAVAEYGVRGMHVYAMLAGDQRERLVYIMHKLVGRACRTGIVSRCLDTAVKRSRAFKAAHIVALPAVHRDGGSNKRRKRRFGINAERGVTRTRGRVDSIFIHNRIPAFQSVC